MKIGEADLQRILVGEFIGKGKADILRVIPGELFHSFLDYVAG
jgi:hypothetical protein